MWSSSGSTASLLGCGVKWELRRGADNLSLRPGFRGDTLTGRLPVELGVAGFAKKPWRVRCPPLELDFFNVDGVGVGVDDTDFLAILPV